MSSETDHPRQRTVAELLAEHGNGGPSGRRRRRRESDEPDEGAPPGAQAPVVTRDPVAPFAPPDRSVLRDPVPPARTAGPDERRPAASAPPQQVQPQQVSPAQASAAPVQQPQRRPVPPPPVAAPAPVQAPEGPAPAAARPAVAPPAVQAPPVAPPARQTPPVAPPAADRPQVDRPQGDQQGPAAPERDRPTDVMPRYRDDPPEAEDLFTRPIPQQKAAPVDPGSVDPASADPASADPASAEDDGDAGPSTMIGMAPAGAESWHRARTEDAVRDGVGVDDGPPLPVGPVDADEGPAGLGAVDLEKRGDGPPPRERRLGRGSAAKDAAAPTWAAVMGQWIAGALGGAVLWVLFRFLWRNLPVVALASAVLVTVGLVVIVRALLHNDDRRTTIFAVLVGLLLTVSPAILVLMGR
ncbi:hypothetical protein GCM10017691_55170 [Pseudonocardia petroleophila]|uniref:Uncharacterized protein n=1 Tax=Pseudonocardia petroleophila TaxID=37331 RepID=A0A7G7MNP3_9PSEU|nr:hypothetical protein [Pseudonocardia petroleophila]QNG54404.1 hypothetical protein H6H00_11235 [Pseudonocardia petroleophila]